MKLFKSLLASVATAGALLSAAPASATIQMNFYDAVDTLLLTVTYPIGGPPESVSFSGLVNGWRVTTQTALSDIGDGWASGCL